MAKIDAKIPQGPLESKWTNYKNHQKLVNPANKRRLDVIVVGTGLAGASAAAAFKIHLAAHTPSQLRGGSTQQRTTKTTVTRYIVFSTIRSRVGTTAPAKPMYIVSQR